MLNGLLTIHHFVRDRSPVRLFWVPKLKSPAVSLQLVHPCHWGNWIQVKLSTGWYSDGYEEPQMAVYPHKVHGGLQPVARLALNFCQLTTVLIVLLQCVLLLLIVMLLFFFCCCCPFEFCFVILTIFSCRKSANCFRFMVTG